MRDTDAFLGWTGLAILCATFVVNAYVDVSTRRLFKRMLKGKLLDRQLLSEARAVNARRFFASRARLKWLKLRRGTLPADLRRTTATIVMADKSCIGMMTVFIAMWFAGPDMQWV